MPHNAKIVSPMTQAIRVLKAAKAQYTEHCYVYEERGGTAVIARELGIDEHLTVKTLIFETDERKPFIILMHCDQSVSTQKMARILGVKRVAPCEPAQAERNSGYHCGGTSPFGTRKKMPVYVQQTILELPEIYINGGQRGFVLKMSPKVVQDLLAPTPVDVAIDSL
ncbi:MAG: aminoacyl-tRNA deacylase [Victivallales bacterium]|nr:aminoacyl-tRNA deacylase [Victivallales bacterium]